jgi:pimeloyl-ACP methyl ester carboxylesterase
MPPCVIQTIKGPIEYRLEGSGPTMMVLNGGHCNRDTRLSHEKLARHGFRVLTPSRPGYDHTPSTVGRSAQDAADALAALLDLLDIATVDLIGISAAGPTALAFAVQHSHRLRKLVLESAVTLPWEKRIKRGARLIFGPTEGLTWAFMRLALNIAPTLTIQTLLRGLTSLDVREVYKRMDKNDIEFVRHMIRTSRSGEGFLNDIEHKVEDLSAIHKPVLVMYSPHDKSVSPENALHAAAAIPNCELFAAQSDTHLIWIGPSAQEVWNRRLIFLSS